MSRTALAFALALTVPLAALAAAPAGKFDSIAGFGRALGMKPGGWRTTYQVTDLEVEGPPGMDPAALASAKARLQAKVEAGEEKDECTGGASSAEQLPGILLDRGCSFGRLEAGKGKWALSSTCPIPGQSGVITIVSHGTYAAEAVSGRHEMDLNFSGLDVHAKVETRSRFTGECRPPAPITFVPTTVEKD